MAEPVTIKDFYAKSAEQEWQRVVKDPFHRLEFETTLYFLSKHLSKGGLLLDAGGGPGRYTIEFAKMGHEVILFDITPELLDVAKSKISENKVGDKVKEIKEGSIIDLSAFPDNHFDGVICIGGPLSHVQGEENRQKAISELVRVAKKGSPVVIAVMGRLSVLQDGLRYWPNEYNNLKHFKELWKDGEDNMFCGKSYCHFFLPEEFEKLIETNGIEIIEKVGLEGLGSHTIQEINDMANNKPETYKAWLESHYALCTHPAVFATSGHMMIIGRKI